MFVVWSSQRTPAYGPVLDHLAHELLAEPAPAVGLEDVDVGEVDEGRRRRSAARQNPIWRSPS